MEQLISAEALRRAAQRADAPRRLTRIADAVLEGKFTWEEVAGGQCEHPLALTLFTPKARETVWPLLMEAEAEIGAEAAPRRVRGADRGRQVLRRVPGAPRNIREHGNPLVTDRKEPQ